MPTTRRRHAITESEEISQALKIAARRWPGESPTRLLGRLIHAGAAQVEREGDAARGERIGAVSALIDLGHHYPAGYLDDVRVGWPE